MSLLADHQLKKFCKTPNFILTREYGDPVINENNPEAPAKCLTVTEPCYYDEAFIQELMKDDNSYIHYAPANEAEKVAIARPMIYPFIPNQVRVATEETIAACNMDDIKVGDKIISYGLSSYGYDVRLASEFKIFTDMNSAIIDPLNFSEDVYFDHKGSYCIIPPGGYMLSRTVEYFRIPRDITAVCVGKSTYARVGAVVNVTPIEAGFEGYVVIEISNATRSPMKIYAGMGISQFLFHKGNKQCEVSYADRDGKYQGQTGIVVARV